MIRFDSVSKHYPDGTVAVDSLDLVAPSGQITVFVGPSGCGKTTSLRMINRMIEPTSGKVWLDDKDTSAIATHELIMVEQSASVEEAVQAMRARDVRRLLVCDADRNLVGILSLSDVALLPTSASA